MPSSFRPFDLAVVGAGICGLAHALAAVRKGKRVVVIDRDAQANGASVRNFGFITVTGQQGANAGTGRCDRATCGPELAAAAENSHRAARPADDCAPAEGPRRAPRRF